MVVLRSSIRAASVPVGEPDIGLIDSNLAAQQSLWFSKAAINDANDLSSASKRHDQEFLRDINAKLLVNSPFAPHSVNYVTKKNYALPRRSHPPPTSTSHLTSVIRTDGSSADDDSSLDYQVQLMTPVTNRMMRSNRASSLPPQSSIYSAAAAAAGGGYPVIIRGREYYNHPHYDTYITSDPSSVFLTDVNDKRLTYDLHVSPASTADSYYHQKLTPMTDLAVRQAHRNLDRIERELKSAGNTTLSTRSTSPGPRVYRSTYSERVLPRRRSSSYHGPRSNVIRSVSPVSSSHLTSPTLIRRHVRPAITKTSSAALNKEISDSWLFSSDSSDFYPVTSTSPSVVSYRSRIESSPSPPPAPPPHLPLPVLTKQYLANPSKQILFIDHQYHTSPDYLLHPSAFIHKKHIDWQAPAPSVTSVHGLHTPAPAPLFTSVHSSFSPAHKPPAVPKTPTFSAPLSPPGLPQVARPKLSETRKRVRDVLCKVKGDPHYFDY